MMNKKPKWYSKAPTKKNKDWTHQNRVKIYTLRVEEEQSVDEIIDTFGGKVTKNQVYNQIRIAKGSLHSECFICRKSLTDEEMQTRRTKHNMHLCTGCREKQSEYKKIRRNTARNEGKCGVCQTNVALPGKTACRSCLSATYRRRIEKGYCGICGKRRITKASEVHCNVCLKNAREMALIRRAKKRKTHAV